MLTPGERGGMPDVDGGAGLLEWNPNIRGERVLEIFFMLYSVTMEQRRVNVNI